MIKEFATTFQLHEKELYEQFLKDPPSDWTELVKAVVCLLHVNVQVCTVGTPNPDTLREIGEWDYSGNMLYYLSDCPHNPCTYYLVAIWYGSWCGCDALEDARGHSTEESAKLMVDLARHVVQNLKAIEPI